MMDRAKKRVLRLIIADHEDVIYWDPDVDVPTLHNLVVYVIDQLRKSFMADTFAYRDFENRKSTRDDIAVNQISPIFLTIPNRPELQTIIEVDPRRYKNVYMFKDNNTVRIQKFDNLNRLEEKELKLTDIQTENLSNKDAKFDTASLASELDNKIKIKIQPTEEETKVSSADSNGLTKATKPGPKNTISVNGTLKADLPETDSRKRPIANTNGRTQDDFIKMTEMNKHPLGRPVTLQQYTLEDVAKHKTKADCWMVLNGKVYDITKYILYHPGGDQILKGAGKDGTSLFNQYHSWVNAEYLLAKYHIGSVKKGNTLM